MEKEVYFDGELVVHFTLDTSEIHDAIMEESTPFAALQYFEAWDFAEVWDWVTQQDEYKEKYASIVGQTDKVKELEALVEKQNLKLELLDRIFKSVQALSEQMSHTTNVLETEINSAEEAGMHDISTAYSDNGVGHA